MRLIPPVPRGANRANARRSIEGFISRNTRERLARAVARRLQHEERFDAGEIALLQQQRTAHALARAVRHTAYYRELAEDLRIDHRALSSPDALAHFPLTEKAALIARSSAFRDRRYPSWILRHGYSSGTSGTPLTVYRDPFSIAVEHAFVHRQWQWAGVDVYARCVVLRGAMLFDAQKLTPPFWHYNAPERQLIMSSYHLSERTIGFYEQALFAFRPRAIQAYPSSAYLLARLLGRARSRRLGIRAIFTSSEMLLPAWKRAIEEAFGCPLFDYYGNAERTVAAGTCEMGTYHIYPEYGHTEIVSSSETAPAGRIVGTPFHSRAMPLIRYDSKDMARPSQHCCPCGRAFPVIEELEGRWDDFVVTSDGRHIGRLDHVFKGLDSIVEAQIVQDNCRHIAVFIVQGEHFSSAVEADLRRNLLERTASDMEIDVVYVDAIPRGANGKFRAVVSTLPH